MEYVNCILCNSSKNSIEEKVKDRFDKNSIYSIVKCECGMKFDLQHALSCKTGGFFFTSTQLPMYKIRTASE